MCSGPKRWAKTLKKRSPNAGTMPCSWTANRRALRAAVGLLAACCALPACTSAAGDGDCAYDEGDKLRAQSSLSKQLDAAPRTMVECIARVRTYPGANGASWTRTRDSNGAWTDDADTYSCFAEFSMTGTEEQLGWVDDEYFTNAHSCQFTDAPPPGVYTLFLC